MRAFIVKLLFRLIEGNTITRLTKSEQTELRGELAKAYEGGVFLKWLNEKEKLIFTTWRSGVGESDNLLRGRLLELESFRQEMRESYKIEQKAAEQREQSKKG